MRQLLLIGIGAGALELVTVEAIEALNRVDVFLMIDKGETTADLTAVRNEVLRRYATQRPYRAVEIPDLPRGGSASYEDSVAEWHHRRLVALEGVLSTSVRDDECAGILVWGDPSLYDSATRLVDELASRGRVEFEHHVIAGISSVQLLAARHRIALNRIGRSVHITTGRLLRSGLPAGVDDVVVMLDGMCSFTTLVGQGFDIYGGAYLGTPDEILRSGALDDLAAEIVETRAEARRRKGWIFDIYLLRRRHGP